MRHTQADIGTWIGLGSFALMLILAVYLVTG